MAFEVTIARTGISTAAFIVEGPSTAQAVEQALEAAHNHDFGSDDRSEYEVVHVGHSNGLKPYLLMLVEFSQVQFPHDEGLDHIPIRFACMAEDFDHALEQAENAYPGCHVIGTDDGAILSPNELERLGYEVWSDEDRPELSQSEDEDNAIDMGEPITNRWYWANEATGEESEKPFASLEDACRDATRNMREAEEAAFDEQILAWLENRVADGDLDIRDLCVRAVRYGRMAPPEFIAEMKERLLAAAGE